MISYLSLRTANIQNVFNMVVRLQPLMRFLREIIFEMILKKG